eukprot:TRINITY_DN3872_c0_g1_i1.p1 TRINITY_DN3872_c0_g1~~TRINITY_DN3872_c0_g1_i1.p1  ORF type:complete len:993 (+),score=238.82 TRINITY_DN3872_c0_g1_i1:109-3087(+)
MDDRRTRLTALLRQYEQHASGDVQSTKVLEDCVALLRQCLGDDDASRVTQEMFLEFITDKTDLWKQHPRLSTTAADSMIDSLLLICNRNPSVLAAKSMTILTQMLSIDERLFNRFKPSKVNLMKLCLPLYIQGPDLALRKSALDFAVILLTSSANPVEIEDISTDPAVINKVSWAERRRAWDYIRAEEATVGRLLEKSELHEGALSNLNRTVGRMDVTIDQLHSEIETLKTKALAQEVSLNDLRRSADRQVDQQAQTRQQIENIDESIATIFKQMHAHEDNIVLLNETSDAQEAVLQRLTKQCSALEHTIGSSEQAIAEQRAMVKTIESHMLEAENALERLRSTMSPLESSMTKLSAEMHTLSLSVYDVKGVAESSQANLQSVVGANRELGSAMVELKAAVESIDGSLTNLQTATDQQLASMRGANKGHEAALHQLRVEAGGGLSQTKAAVKAVEESLHELRAAVDVQSSAIARTMELGRTVEDLHAVARDLQQTVQALQDEAGTQNAEIDKLNNTTGAHQLTLRDMLSATEAASTQIDTLQSTAESLEHTVEELWQTSSAQLAQFKDTMVQEFQRSATDLTQLKRQVDEQAALARRLETAARDIDNIIESMRSGGGLASLAPQQQHQQQQQTPQPLPAPISHTASVGVMSSSHNASSHSISTPAPSVVERNSTEYHPRGSISSIPSVSAPTIPVSSGQSGSFGSDPQAHVKNLMSISGDANSKLDSVSWLATHSNSVPPAKIFEVADAFLQWSANNSALIKKANGPHREALITIMDQLKNTRTQSQARSVALALLECLLRADQNIATLMTIDGVDVLTSLLTTDDEETVVGALRAIRASTRNTHCILRLRDRSGLQRLIALMRHHSGRVAEQAVAAVRSTTRLDDIVPDITVAGGMEVLASLLRTTDNDYVLEHVVGALRNCARLDSSITAIQATGALATLYSVLKSSTNPEIQKACAGALRACAKNPRAQAELQQQGALDYLGLRYPQVK